MALAAAFAIAGCGSKEFTQSKAERDYADKLDKYLHAQMAMQMYVESVGTSLDRGDYASARIAQRKMERGWKMLTEAADDLDVEASQWIPEPNDDQRDSFRPYPQ